MFFTWELLIQIITSFVTAVAFAVMFRINKHRLFMVGLCGLVTYAVYYTLLFFTESLFVAAFVSSMATALYAEIFARVLHAPTVIFVLPGIIPTVPGGYLYRGMRDLLLRNISGTAENFIATLEVGLGIAGGIVAVSIIFGIILDAIASHKNKKAKKSVDIH